ncbi:hypothetical protein LINPERHAP2_LOCUS39627 [Linum perenne]
MWLISRRLLIMRELCLAVRGWCTITTLSFRSGGRIFVRRIRSYPRCVFGSGYRGFRWSISIIRSLNTLVIASGKQSVSTTPRLRVVGVTLQGFVWRWTFPNRFCPNTRCDEGLGGLNMKACTRSVLTVDVMVIRMMRASKNLKLKLRLSSLTFLLILFSKVLSFLMFVLKSRRISDLGCK